MRIQRLSVGLVAPFQADEIKAAGKCPTGISPLEKGTNEKSKAFQPCFILLSIVMHDAVSILRILPQRLRCRLKVLSSILPEEKINLSQLSVSAHSFRAISNLDSISARL